MPHNRSGEDCLHLQALTAGHPNATASLDRRRVRLHRDWRGLGRLRAGQPAIGRTGPPRSAGMSRPEPDEGLNGRSLAYPRGKVIGGSSAINAMIYMRGQAADYDHWRQLGLEGWGWRDVLAYFKQHEDHFLGPSEHHGVGGEWRIEPPRVSWDVLQAYRAAAAQAGIRPIEDFNTGDNEGPRSFHVHHTGG